jgi:hypothetical protein
MPQRTTPASVRQRQYRRRLRAGIGVARVAYDRHVVELLVQMRLLGELQTEDRKAINAALAQLIADAAKRYA